MSTTVASLNWTVKRGTRLTRQIRWLQDSAVRTPTEVVLTVRNKPGGTVLLTLAVGTGVTLSTDGAGKRATIVITEAQSTAFPVGSLPFDIVPTIDSTQQSIDAIDGLLVVARAQKDI